ncbi:MAG: homoserine kinase [Woeseiaceae bacterium]|nr:homoserine kinase [Woeseiaceae bacterium]
MTDKGYVTAFAPASIGNVGVGYDILGLAIAGAGDRVSARKIDKPGVHIAEIFGLDGEVHPYLNRDPEHNTASIAAKALWDDKGNTAGIELIVRKGVPLQSGMGSSAASAVAAAVAVNELLDEPLATLGLLPYALEGEKYASGALHADNVAPSLLGGLVYCPKALLPDAYCLPTPSGISSVLVHPELQVDTAKQRKILARSYSLELWREQQSYLAGFIAGCEQNDPELIRRCLKDVIIEPQRKGAVPCFDAVKEAALAANALGCSLSGSGPSIFALCVDADAGKAAAAMLDACRAAGFECQSWISPMTAPGASTEHHS